MYKVCFNRRYIKDLEKIPKQDRDRISTAITELVINPRPPGCKKLKGYDTPPLYRLRCGDYRILYAIEDSNLLILVVEIGHRREIYS